MYTPSLPYRRLVKFANGLWDEARKEFYPFNISNARVLGKCGIHYYVRTAGMSYARAGIVPASTAYWTGTIRGATRKFAYIITAAQTQATDYSNVCSVSDIGVVFDASTDLTISNGTGWVVYAEIPSDPAGGPVVVQ